MDKNELIDQLEQLNIGLRRSTVSHKSYSDCWPKAFELIVSLISPVLNDGRIHHIGSTAILGCIAKPILDIAVEYHPHSSNFEKETVELVGLGFTSKGPYGVEGRSFFTFYNDEETYDYIHIHAYIEHSPKIKAYLAFRDAHLADLSLVKKYNSLKEDLVKKGISRKDYPDAKTNYVEDILLLLEEA